MLDLSFIKLPLILQNLDNFDYTNNPSKLIEKIQADLHQYRDNQTSCTHPIVRRELLILRPLQQKLRQENLTPANTIDLLKDAYQQLKNISSASAVGLDWGGKYVPLIYIIENYLSDRAIFDNKKLLELIRIQKMQHGQSCWFCGFFNALPQLTQADIENSHPLIQSEETYVDLEVVGLESDLENEVLPPLSTWENIKAFFCHVPRPELATHYVSLEPQYPTSSDTPLQK